MQNDIINFVHANGFPAKSYNTFLDNFSTDFQVIALDKYGHDPLYAITHNWQYLVDELIQFVIKQKKLLKRENDKVINIGHSFGGVISFMAACQRPDLFKAVIMLDPPAFTGATAFMMKLLKGTKLFDKISPAGKAKIRRKQWPLNADMVNQFKHKALFKNFDPRCLSDYATHGIVKRNQRQELLFSAEVEAEVFRTLPVNLASYKKKLDLPATLIYAQDGVCTIRAVNRFAKKNDINVLKMPNSGHMFPLEQPEKTAELIKKIISNLSC
jgi:pimeloyl-ACP methyl ester carboxylesterase